MPCYKETYHNFTSYIKFSFIHHCYKHVLLINKNKLKNLAKNWDQLLRTNNLSIWVSKNRKP